MIWSSLPNDERLRLWKNLRNEIEDYPIEQKLEKIAKFCSSMPIGSRSIDYYSSENWPTPWEILYHGSFCTSSISLLIFHTVTLTASNIQARLDLVEDSYGIYLLPVIDNHFVLNYELGKISILSDIKDSVTTIKIFEQDQIKKLT